MHPLSKVLIWSVLGTATLIPMGLAAASPQLAWRDPVYIIAGFAGVLGMVLLVFQPLFAAGFLPDIGGSRARRLHRLAGLLLLIAVLVHVLGLWITSPPDVIDALLFVSATPFSVWGVIAMWAVFAAALMVAFRKRMMLRPAIWRLGHSICVTIVVLGTVAHALLIEGTMETVSKVMLAILLVVVLALALARLKVWKGLMRR